MTRPRLSILTGGSVILTVLFLSQLSCVSRRGATVENLRRVSRALEDFELRHGALPASLEELALPVSDLRDGNGEPFVLYRNDYRPRKRHGLDPTWMDWQYPQAIVVGMAAPTSHHVLDSENRWYALARGVDDGRLEIVSHTARPTAPMPGPSVLRARPAELTDFDGGVPGPEREFRGCV